MINYRKTHRYSDFVAQSAPWRQKSEETSRPLLSTTSSHFHRNTIDLPYRVIAFANHLQNEIHCTTIPFSMARERSPYGKSRRRGLRKQVYSM